MFDLGVQRIALLSAAGEYFTTLPGAYKSGRTWSSKTTRLTVRLVLYIRMFHFLVDEDKEKEVKILGIDVEEESVVGMDHYFRKGALWGFLDWDSAMLNKRMMSKHGMVLYFPSNRGPWFDKALGIGKYGDGRETMKLALRVGVRERGAGARTTGTRIRRPLQSAFRN